MQIKLRIIGLIIGLSLIVLLASTISPTHSQSMVQVANLTSPASEFTSTPQPTPLPTPVHKNFLSPEQITGLIRDKQIKKLREIWYFYENLWPKGFFDIYENFSVQQRLYIETETPEIEYAIVIVVEEDNRRDWMYMLFKRTRADWHYVGTIGLDAKYLTEPSYQIINADGHNIWLVVRWLANSGTGLIQFEENWYNLNSEKLKVSLRYPVYGSEEHGTGQAPASIEFRGERSANFLDPTTGIYTVDVLFEVSYLNSFEDNPQIPLYYRVLSIQRKARFLWNEEKRRFRLDPKNSNILKEEIDKNFNYNTNEFVEYAYQELLEVATNGSDLQKKWLTLLLNQTKDSPEKETLLKQLKP